jgi:hypothetical protein
VGHAAYVAEKINLCRVLVGKPEGKRTLTRCTRRWDDYLKMYLEKDGRNGVDWVHPVGISDGLF